MVYCVALDPGGTTGIAVVQTILHPWFVDVEELGPGTHYQRLLQRLTLWEPEVIVCESFQNRSQDAVVLASVEYIGIVKLYCEITNTTLMLHTASAGKAFWDDKKLHEYGLYQPGLKHARDAIRHYLHYRTFTVKDMSLLEHKLPGAVAKLPDAHL